MPYKIPKGTNATIDCVSKGVHRAYLTKVDLYFRSPKIICGRGLLVFQYDENWRLTISEEDLVYLDKEGNEIEPDPKDRLDTFMPRL